MTTPVPDPRLVASMATVAASLAHPVAAGDLPGYLQRCIPAPAADPHETDMLAVARDLLSRGFSVIPLDHPDDTWVTDPDSIGKTAAIKWKTFQTSRPTDLDLVAWFGKGQKRNVAILTGAVSNLVMIDGDSAEGLAWMHASLPPTPLRTKTAKGEHWGYRHPGVAVGNKVRIDTGDPAVKIDARGDGGYVVAPGSLHRTGVAYGRLGDWPPTSELPVFDPAWLKPEAADARPAPVALPKAIPDGERNGALFKEGCRLRRHGWSETEIARALSVLNIERCRPPLDPREVETVARSCAKYEPDAAPAAGADAHPLTEAGDAEFFAERYAGRVCFDARRSRWLLIEDESGLWLPDPVERLRGYAVESTRARQRWATAIEDLEKRKQAWGWAFKGESTTRLSNLLREARTQPAIRNDSLADPWDADPFLLGVPGGVVELRTGAKRRARPEERVTMRAGAEYDPAARSPLWENALREISDDDPDWVSYLQRLGGYTATGDVSQDKWFIKHGKDGREGKGTIDGAWMGALGDYTLELPSAVFELRPKSNRDFDLSYLPGKRFVLSSETGNTIHLNHDRIKNMTGGGKFREANKHEKSFEFFPSCKLWLACNDLPMVTDDSSAFWARVIVIPFRRSFLGKEDTTLRPALSNDPAHRRAVLAWLVKGAVDYARGGLGPMPKSVREATNEFRDVAWPLTPFVREDCVVDDAMRVSVGDFNQGYHRFCDRQGVPAERRLGWKRVLRLMEVRFTTVGVDEMTEMSGRVREKRYLGIGLRDPVVNHDAGGTPF